MAQQLASGGVLLLSGLLEQDFKEIRAAAGNNHFGIKRRLDRENWICLELGKINS